MITSTQTVMDYCESNMLYDGDAYYRWESVETGLSPYYLNGSTETQLDRTSGSEVLFFINDFVSKYLSGCISLRTFTDLETAIRYSVPEELESHAAVRDWIIDNYRKITS